MMWQEIPNLLGRSVEKFTHYLVIENDSRQDYLGATILTANSIHSVKRMRKYSH
ncbi:hypothetical protein THZG08_570003 [Vibrio owensii]|nr:hypothetical protein THZG08_570003 [Vibrio owensii]CAH1586096.1 hypothetical protein THOA03_570003 [Vibrio owensii]